MCDSISFSASFFANSPPAFRSQRFASEFISDAIDLLQLGIFSCPLSVLALRSFALLLFPDHPSPNNTSSNECPYGDRDTVHHSAAAFVAASAAFSAAFAAFSASAFASTSPTMCSTISSVLIVWLCLPAP